MLKNLLNSKLFRIFRSFLGYRNVSEAVYKERLRICNACPFNSKNIRGRKSWLWKLYKRVRSMIFHGEGFCTICGCQIKQKAGLSLEQCPLPEPKWNKLVVETLQSMQVNFELLSKSKDINATISTLSETFSQLNISSDFTAGEEYKFSLKTIFPTDIVSESYNIVVGCDCLKIHKKIFEKNSISFDLSIKPTYTQIEDVSNKKQKGLKYGSPNPTYRDISVVQLSTNQQVAVFRLVFPLLIPDFGD